MKNLRISGVIVVLLVMNFFVALAPPSLVISLLPFMDGMFTYETAVVFYIVTLLLLYLLWRDARPLVTKRVATKLAVLYCLLRALGYIFFPEYGFILPDREFVTWMLGPVVVLISLIAFITKKIKGTDSPK